MRQILTTSALCAHRSADRVSMGERIGPGPHAIRPAIARGRPPAAGMANAPCPPTPANDNDRHGPPTGRLAIRRGRINQWPDATARAERIGADPAITARVLDSGGRKWPPTGRLQASSPYAADASTNGRAMRRPPLSLPWAAARLCGPGHQPSPSRPPSPSPSQVRREARPRPSCPSPSLLPRFRFMPASPKCPPAASASPPAMAMPRRERIGGERGSRARRRASAPQHIFRHANV